LSAIGRALVWLLPIGVWALSQFAGNRVTASITTGLFNGTSGFGLFGPLLLLLIAIQVSGVFSTRSLNRAVGRFTVVSLGFVVLAKILDPVSTGSPILAAMAVQGNVGVFDSSARMVFSWFPTALFLYSRREAE
jgi:hypothetical protein